MSVFAWVRQALGGDGETTSGSPSSTQSISQSDFDALTNSAQRMADIINESLQLSNKSRNPETKISRLHLAKSTLSELEAMAARYPFLQLIKLTTVQNSIVELEREYADAGYYAEMGPRHINSATTYNRTVGDMQTRPVSDWGHDDIITGVIFSATLQLRTPLRIIQRHQEVFTGPGVPPAIADEAWHGLWLPTTKSSDDLGIDLGAGATVSSDIGPIPSDGGAYLKLLLAIRSVVERRDAASQRREDLNKVLSEAKWKAFVAKLGGRTTIINQFFPQFVSTLPGLRESTVDELIQAGLTTPAAIAAVSDAQLLAIKGIGKTNLKKIRAVCTVAPDSASEYADLVER